MSVIHKNYEYPASLNPIQPGPDQESVWDYPKPPRYESVSSHIRIEFQGHLIAETQHAVRSLQTGIPPVYYIPPEDVHLALLTPTDRHSHCPFKGDATYWTIQVGEYQVSNAAWSYPNPLLEAASLKAYLAFYAHAVDGYVNGEKVKPPDWKWLGGWVTSDVVGPFMTQAHIPPQEKLQYVQR